MLKLRVRPPGSPPYQVELRTFPVRIGRSPSCELRLEDPFVSRHHVELSWVQGELRILDTGSGNGTFLNGLRTTSGMVLRGGDRLRLGNTVLELDRVPGGEAVTRPIEAGRGGERRAGPPTPTAEPRRLAALEILNRLQPSSPPEVEGYELASAQVHSGEVSGDWVDFIALPDGRLLLAVGDVSGKGLEAAMLAASVHSAMRSHAATDPSLVALVDHLNGFLSRHSPPNRFVAVFVAALDPQAHRVEFINAGFPRPPLVRVDGSVESLPPSGLPLGIRHDVVYAPGVLSLAPGDVLWVVSDGLLEASNSQGGEFGLARLLEVTHRYRGALASELQVLMEQEVATFVGQEPPGDDRTLMILRREV